MTARHSQGRLAGVTANSFSSVSLEPPIVLWSLALASPSLEVFEEAGAFVINVLTQDQVLLAQRFASRLVDKFQGVAHRAGRLGLPVIDDCAATIECRMVDRKAIGDHVLLFGQVEHYAYRRVSPLLFCQGSFMQAAHLMPLGATTP